MSKKHKKTCRNLNYFRHFLIFVSAVSGFASIYTFASLVDISREISSSAVGLEICALTERIKKYKLDIKKKKKKLDKNSVVSKC